MVEGQRVPIQVGLSSLLIQTAQNVPLLLDDLNAQACELVHFAHWWNEFYICADARLENPKVIKLSGIGHF